MKRPAAILDRDGTVIEDVEYVRDPAKVAWLPRAAEGLKLIVEKGYELFVVSNQSGVGRGLITQPECDAVHAQFVSMLASAGVKLSGHAYCYHRPEENCECRKPKAGLIPKDRFDLGRSFVAGDKDSDLQLADAIGGKGYLVLTGKGARTREEMSREGTLARYVVCADLLEVASKVPRL